MTLELQIVFSMIHENFSTSWHVDGHKGLGGEKELLKKINTTANNKMKVAGYPLTETAIISTNCSHILG